MGLPPGLSHIRTSSGQRVRGMPRKRHSLFQLLFMLSSQGERIGNELSALGTRARVCRKRLAEIERDKARFLDLVQGRRAPVLSAREDRGCSGARPRAPTMRVSRP
jgi:hypothetical protein